MISYELDDQLKFSTLFILDDYTEYLYVFSSYKVSSQADFQRELELGMKEVIQKFSGRTIQKIVLPASCNQFLRHFQIATNIIILEDQCVREVDFGSAAE